MPMVKAKDGAEIFYKDWGPKDAHRCSHPPCTCTVPHGTKYCGAECEAKGEMPEIDCN